MPSADTTLRDRVRCVCMLVLLQCMLPFSLACVAAAMLRRKVRVLLGREAEPEAPAGEMRTVLLTGGKMTKALLMARAIKRSSVPTRVVLVETEKFRFCGSRFSNCVDAFETVRCPRREGGEAYVEDLVRLFRQYAVDVFVPVSSPAAAVWDSEAKTRAAAEKLTTKCLHFDPETTRLLDDKDAFAEFCRETLGMRDSVPVSTRVRSDDEARAVNKDLAARGAAPCVLKNLSYDPIHRLDLFKLPCEPSDLDAYLARIRKDGNPISAEEPWQVQQFIKGEEYSAFAVLRGSRLQALTVCESSPSQLNYRHVDVPCVEAWVRAFLAGCLRQGLHLDGQLCWDFLVDGSDRAWPIECNPRIHSQVCVYAPLERELGDALVLGTGARDRAGSGRDSPGGYRFRTLYPPNSAQWGARAQPPQDYFWMYNEVFKACGSNALLKYCAASAPAAPLRLWRLLRTLLSEQEVDLDARDPLPFLLRNHLQLPGLLLDTLREGNGWTKLDFNIGKVVEVGGD